MTLRVSGSRGTEIISLPAVEVFESRIKIRQMTDVDFIEHKGSGTLRKNHAIGMNTKSHLLHERIAYEFGYAFEALPERFVTWGEPRSEPDCKAVTEVGWHVERYASVCLFPGDGIEVKYIIIEENGARREGIGIVVRKTSVQWLPKGFMVFAIIAQLNPETHDFYPAVNPC